MPDDYQTLFAELTGTAPVGTETPAPSTAPAEETSDTEETVNTETTSTEETKTEETVEETSTPVKQEAPKEDPTAKAFAAMRAANSKYQKVFNKLQEALGVDDEDAVIEKLLGVSYDTLGKKQNVDPAVLKRLTELEEVNQALINERRQEFVIGQFEKVRTTFNLSEPELMEFAQALSNSNVDIFASNLDLSALYKGLNFDKLQKKTIESEKQKWIKEQGEANAAPSVNSITGKRDPNSKKEINTMSDLDLALKSLNN